LFCFPFFFPFLLQSLTSSQILFDSLQY
jgi:hypothetical protein